VSPCTIRQIQKEPWFTVQNRHDVCAPNVMPIEVVFINGVPNQIEDGDVYTFAYHCMTKCTTRSALPEKLRYLRTRDDLQLVVARIAEHEATI